MPNWGDQLYPPVLGSLLEAVDLRATRTFYSPLEGKTVDHQPVQSLHAVRDSGADVAFVGGGDIVRFDTLTVAMDHRSVPTGDRGRRLTRLRSRSFARRHFLPGPGVWVPEDGWLEHGRSVLLSVGVHTVPDTSAAHRAMSRYDAAWVRTANGAERLAGAGVDAQRITVAPDMVFALPELQAPEATIERGRAIFRDRLGLDEPPLVFHAAQFHGWPVERVAAALTSLRGIPTTTLALGSYAGENLLLEAAAKHSGARSLTDLSATDITAVLSAAGTVFTTSMHAAIVGASFGTPVIVPGVGKTRDAFAVLPDPPVLHGSDDSSLYETAASLMGSRLVHSPEANRDAVVEAFSTTMKAAGLL